MHGTEAAEAALERLPRADVPERRDQSGAPGAGAFEVHGGAGEGALVHVEAARQLDLDRVDAVLRAAVAARRVPAAVGLVVADLEAGVLGVAFDRVDQDRGGGAAAARAGDHVGPARSGVAV